MAKFKIQARVLDLLGDQQIANGPTAISELFKNAHDAYATQAKLDIYPDDDRALFWDDGVGMSEADLLDKWLVVGTSAKSENRGAPPPEGYIARPIQGEKGIGRLAISTLGDSLLLVSKSRFALPGKDRYAALFINWNIVKNLKLMLNDIDIPVVSFADLDELDTSIVGYMVGAFRNSLSQARSGLWEGAVEAQLRTEILKQLDAFDYLPIFLQRTDLQKRDGGTLFYIRHLRKEVAIYGRPPSEREEDYYAPNAELIQLLSNFRNHLTDRATARRLPHEPGYAFDVDVRHWDSNSSVFASVFQSWQTFELEDLRAYDHKIDVSFDEHGRYEGTIEVFGNKIDLPPIAHQGRRPMTCGPFELKLWYFQGQPNETKLNADQFTLIQKKLRRYGGLMIYRDGLRVLPYGRPDNDWLQFEQRRSRNAGRYFFSYRRMFGYVAISSASNSMLRDKSGREGLIANTEYRQFQRRLVQFFCDIAVEYFTGNEIFEQTMEELQDRAGLVGKQQKKVAARREALKEDLKAAVSHMEQSTPKLEMLLADSLADLHTVTEPGERELTAALVDFREKLSRIEAGTRVAKPKTLSMGRDRQGNQLLHDHKQEKERFDQACRGVNEKFSVAIKKFFPEAEHAAVRHKTIKDERFRAHARIGKTFSSLISSRDVELAKLDKALVEFRDEQLRRVDDAILAETGADSVDDALLSNVGDLPAILAAIARVAEEGSIAINERADDLCNHIQGFFAEQREAILAAQTDVIEELRETVDRNLDLVQLGLTVEIIDHELGKLYLGIKADLARLSVMVQGYKAGIEVVDRLRAHFQHLEQRYKLMSPLYRGTYRTKSEITGTKILEYVREFLQRSLEAIGVTIRATSAGHALRLSEVQAVVLPVFVNLVDNAIYWLREAPEKRILLDMRDGIMTICDTGPGIHDVLLERIFEPFFSTKPNGRGLGLYVAKVNLERYGHKIWATNESTYRSLSGACFCIQFNKDAVVSV